MRLTPGRRRARAAVADALLRLAATDGVTLLAASSVYRTAPIDSSGPDYLNAVASVDTTLAAPALLAALHAIEQAHGRERPYRNAPRTLDLDILLYGDAVIDLPTLHVPHPRMLARAFVLVPLLEIAPDIVVPGHGPAAASPRGPATAVLRPCRPRRQQTHRDRITLARLASLFAYQRTIMSSYLQGKDMAGADVPAAAKPAVANKAVTIPSLNAMRAAGNPIVMLTAYDASFASLMDRCGVEVLLIGDSLGMVCNGHTSTLPVTVQEVAYHTAAVARGAKSAMVLADMPFGSYATPEAAFHNAVTLMQAGAHMVKLEGGAWLADTIRFLTERAVPVCAHLGLTPQSVHQLGGYKVQGKTIESADQLKADALLLQAAGASLLVLEAIPSALGKEVTELLTMPTIGIGAGPDCSGQVLVMHDLLGVFPGRKARFVKNFMDGQTSIDAAVMAYVAAVKDHSFPAIEHCF